MANLEKLIEILHTDKEIKDELTELKFGCKIKNKHTGGIVYLLQSGDDGVLVYNGVANHILYDRNIEIIGTEPEIRHILWYCKKITDETNGLLHFEINQSGMLISIVDGRIDTVTNICRLDNKLSLSQEKQETIDTLVEYLSNIK